MSKKFFSCLFLLALGPATSLGGAVCSSQGAAGFKLRDKPGQYVDVLFNGQIVARYMYAYDPSSPGRAHETYKPYLHVFDPEDGLPITKGPGGLYTHHRGIFIGWRRVRLGKKSYDLWGMSRGVQIHERFLTKEAYPDRALIGALVVWCDRERKPLVREERTMIFESLEPPGMVFIRWQSKLEAVRGDVLLRGDPEHGGIQYRPADEIDRAETSYFFPKKNADPRVDRDYPWVGETYALRGKRYTVVHMNHPQNPKGTIYSAYRDYGRFGAFFSARLKAGFPLVVRYGFAVYKGRAPEAARIQSLWDRFAGCSKPSPVPEITVRTGETKRRKAR